MQDTQRKQERTERDQLLTLVNQWDPAGLLGAGAARHEYGPLVDKLFTLLERESSADTVTDFLDSEVRGQFGIAPPQPAQFAAKVLTWSRLRSQDA